MFLRLLILFTAVPLLELYLLLVTGRWLGLLPTIALVVGTGTLGAWLARSQGLTTLARVRRELAEGSVPTGALVEGLLILVAGAVLLTPGLLTDACGFLLLIPASRRRLRDWLKQRWQRHAAVHQRVVVVEDWREL